MHFFHKIAIFLSAKKRCKNTFFPTLHPLSPVIFATATVVAFLLLHNSRFNFHCYTQRETMPTQKSAWKWHCDLSRLHAWKITKSIHSCKPASLNRPINLLSFSLQPFLMLFCWPFVFSNPTGFDCWIAVMEMFLFYYCSLAVCTTLFVYHNFSTDSRGASVWSSVIYKWKLALEVKMKTLADECQPEYLSALLPCGMDFGTVQFSNTFGGSLSLRSAHPPSPTLS